MGVYKKRNHTGHFKSKKLSFHEGGLHESLGVPQGQKIPASKFKAALAGKDGPKAKKQAEFKKNVLTGKK